MNALSIAGDVVAETAGFDNLAKKIHENWSHFRGEAMARGPFAEQGYMNNRAL